MGILDVLNSKTKKIKIELPNYRFSHSSSGDSAQPFIGRERIREKLKRIVEDSPNESGVYLVTGNRGVGKTSLVSEIIKETSFREDSTFGEKLKELFDFKKCKNKYNLLYLRINFGHKLRDEKDIFRLIARTLSTEYTKYRHLLWRMLPWRVILLSVLLFLSMLLFSKIEDNCGLIGDGECVKGVSSNIETKVKTKVGTNGDIKVEKNVKTNVSINGGNLLYEINQVAKKSVFWGQCRPLLLFLLSFCVMYLLYILLFSSNWITHFLVTHQIIARRLKKLNENITHSTQRENAMSINNGNVGPTIGTKIKKSRSVADAREIEKELQDILNDMQQIRRIMCPPQVVIVFDELDKVEPGDASLEKETPQTKASMFSIGATRERQTEILRILSNLKYFLSSSRAKFIFIAGHEMFDIHLADVSERNNYIGSIFNAVIHVPSFLTDHPTSKRSTREESSIASLPEEFVCRKLFPPKYKVKVYNLKSYREYLEEKIFCEESEQENIEKVEKIIAVLQQFIIYLAHVSKGAPKKMTQLFESFIEIRTGKDKYKKENTLLIRSNSKSEYFLTFNYYKQYALGIIAYLITPIFYRLAESNIKAHSDKLLVSSLRFIDFLFKFHKHPFSWWHLDISPELLEANRAPELKSVTESLLKYLTRVHIDELSFSFSNYKFNSVIANEIFAMTKTDEVFSALFSFSLDETLPLKKQYIDLLEKTENEYREKKKSSRYIDVVSSLQAVLGDLYYYDDELEEAELYYNKAIQAFRELEQENDDKKKDSERMIHERFYLYIRNMLRLGMIYERRKLYESAYMAYGESCRRVIQERNMEFKELGVDIRRRDLDGKNVFVMASLVKAANEDDKNYYDNIEVPLIPRRKTIGESTASLQPLNFKNFLPKTYDLMFKRMTYEGLQTLYLPFIAKLQILEKSHVGGITCGHLELLDKEFRYLTFIVNHNEAKILEAEFYTRVADILYYKNSDLMCKNGKRREDDTDEGYLNDSSNDTKILYENTSCTACHYYHKALLVLNKFPNKDTVTELLRISVEQLKESHNINMKYCAILARILSNWGNVLFSCDIRINTTTIKCGSEKNRCYICEENNNTISKRNTTEFLDNCVKYVDPKKEDIESSPLEVNLSKTKRDIAFAMYSISTIAYRNTNQYKLSAYQIYKMLRLFKCYKIYSMQHIENLSKKAINYLWRVNDDLNVPEWNKHKKDFGKVKLSEEITLQNLLVDTEITKIRILVKELELMESKSNPHRMLKDYYKIRITSPYKINYSIVGRIYQLRLKSRVNYEAYQDLLEKAGISKDKRKEKKFTLECHYYNELIDNVSKKMIEETFGEEFSVIVALENLIAESIYCLIDILKLTETMGDTYLFPHSFVGSVHEHLSFWIRQYEAYEEYKNENSKIDEYLKKYLDEEWREQLSGYRENRQAVSHYCKCLEMHSEGRAYHEKIDNMCYVRDDYNDRSDHFNIAEERHLIVNGEIEEKIKELEKIYKGSKLYDVDNYFYR